MRIKCRKVRGSGSGIISCLSISPYFGAVILYVFLTYNTHGLAAPSFQRCVAVPGDLPLAFAFTALVLPAVRKTIAGDMRQRRQ